MANDDPHIIYPCKTVRAVSFPAGKYVHLEFVTTEGYPIAMAMSGGLLVKVRQKIDELLAADPEIAQWKGEAPH